MNIIEKTAALAMAESFPRMIKGTSKPSRLNGLYRKLEKTALKELEALPKLSFGEKAQARKAIDEFILQTGWGKGEQRVLSYISFLLDLFEGKYPAIFNAMRQISDHYEKKGEILDVKDCLAGEVAAQTWHLIFIERR